MTEIMAFSDEVLHVDIVALPNLAEPPRLGPPFAATGAPSLRGLERRLVFR
jgi:hypothetical protein